MAYSIDKQIQSRRHYANKKNGTARRYKQGPSLFSLLDSLVEPQRPVRLSKRERQQLFWECLAEVRREDQINEYLKNRKPVVEVKSLKNESWFDILLVLSFTLFPYIIGNVTDSFFTGLASALSLPFIVIILFSIYWDKSK